MIVVYLLLFLLLPSAVLHLCRRYKWAETIGPILILYFLGLVIGNLGLIPGLPKTITHPEAMPKLQNLLSSAMVPIAIPMLLFGCWVRKEDVKKSVLALSTGIIAVAAAVLIGFFIFHRGIDSSAVGGDTAANIGGMLTGVYTGGTVNLAALKAMLGVSDKTYIMLNTCDMVVSFLYLVFLMAIGIKLFRKFLPVKGLEGNDFSAASSVLDPDKPKLYSKQWWKDAGLLVGATVVIVGVSAGIAALMPDGWFMTVFILLLTTFGLGASFIKKIRSKKIAEDIGMYCIYVFSIVVASMADFSTFDISGSLNAFGYLSVVIFGSLLLQMLLAKLCHIDADTMVISSTAFICSPPFVPMMAAAMKDRRVIVSGLTIGVVGYALGNYLGFLMSKLLEVFSF